MPENQDPIKVSFDISKLPLVTSEPAKELQNVVLKMYQADEKFQNIIRSSQGIKIQRDRLLDIQNDTKEANQHLLTLASGLDTIVNGQEKTKTFSIIAIIVSVLSLIVAVIAIFIK